MKKLIILITLLMTLTVTAQDKDNDLLMLGLWASIDGNLLESGLNRLADVNNLGLKVSGQFTLTQTGAVVQNLLDGIYAVNAFSIDNGFNDVQPTFKIVGDADSDAGGDTEETLTITLTPNATPTSATWSFTTTQANAYLFDERLEVSTSAVTNLKLVRSGNGVAFSTFGNSEGTASLTMDGDAMSFIDASAGYSFDGNVEIDGNLNYALDGQADDDYEIALPGVTALVEGLMVTFTAATANTDGATLEITGISDIDAILKGDGTALATGDITALLPVTVFFNAAGNWIVMSRLASD